MSSDLFYNLKEPKSEFQISALFVLNWHWSVLFELNGYPEYGR